MITVLNPGLFTTVQDAGRWGYQAYGVSVTGAMDRFAYRVANLLAGNAPDAAALEMTVFGGTYHFERACYVALTGADMQAELNGAKTANWSSFFVPAGSELNLGYAASGCRAYMAVHGGIDVPLVLGSRATYTRAGFGGVDGRALQCSDRLNLVETPTACAQPHARMLPTQFIPNYDTHIHLRVLLGPQDDLFTPEGIETLFNSTYTITTDADRMGYRLEGPVIAHRAKADIVSDALCQGAIQVPGHGMPIVMMADRQTTGGYTKIGAVIGSDLSLLAQATPGNTVSFHPCTDEEAVEALRSEEERYNEIKTALAKPGAATTALGPARSFRLSVNEIYYQVSLQEMK